MLQATLLALALLGAPSLAAPAAAPAEPARLVALSGVDQTAQVGTEPLRPVVLQVLTSSGAPVAGVAVQVDVTAGATLLSAPEDLVSDANGRVAVRVRLGPTPGVMRLSARFARMVMPLTVSLRALAEPRLNPAPLAGPLLGADVIDAQGAGVVVLAASGGTYGAPRWKAFRIGADAPSEVVFPDSERALPWGLSALGSDGVVHVLYAVERSDRTRSVRYVQGRDGAFGTAYDTGLTPEDIVDASLVPGVESADLVFLALGHQVQHMNLSRDGAGDVRLLSRTGELATRPAATRHRDRLVVTYIRYGIGAPSPSATASPAPTAALARTEVVLLDGSDRAALDVRDPVQALPLSAGDGLALVYVDRAGGRVKVCRVNGTACPEPSDAGLSATERAQLRAYAVGSDVHVAVLDHGIVSVARTGAVIPAARILLDLSAYPAGTGAALATRADADGRVVIVLDVPGGSEGRGAYLMAPRLSETR